MKSRKSFFQHAVEVLVAIPILWGLMVTSALGLTGGSSGLGSRAFTPKRIAMETLRWAEFLSTQSRRWPLSLRGFLCAPQHEVTAR